jgi:hypothetical protein
MSYITNITSLLAYLDVQNIDEKDDACQSYGNYTVLSERLQGGPRFKAVWDIHDLF